MKNLLPLLLIGFLFIACKEEPQIDSDDQNAIKKIYDQALTKGDSYEWLRDLTSNIGGRLSGSPEAELAVQWGAELMRSLEFDTVYLQPVMVPHWVRGKQESAHFISNKQITTMEICALGGSIATPDSGLQAPVVEVKSIEEVNKLGEAVKGKIVFFNRPFDATLINTFAAYGGCVDQRVNGAATAAKYGALGVIVRSMSSSIDPYPHTGTMSYGDLPIEEYIPSAAISTQSAEKLSLALKKDPNTKVYMEQFCQNLDDAPSFNVVGELKGTTYPDKYITIGGHLDSWDLGDGAHDDGTGVVQSIEVLDLFKKTGIKPKHTLRAVLFMNEENGLRGGKKYAELAEVNKEVHIAALESDAGGHTPRGFSFDPSGTHFDLLMSWAPLFEPYGASQFTSGGSGADIGPLKDGHISLMGYRPDSQRYFDYHHSTQDTFDKVNRRELVLGSASMTSLIYLIDQHIN
ncbi:M20/M25/M40 family metallo-hydrolase [Flavobacteriaceae bacterium]|nr:M20/M25/M40 family metallo-hydrolase [Flavobacteriaceae bacterium]